jgi:hypothetical protein
LTLCCRACGSVQYCIPSALSKYSRSVKKVKTVPPSGLEPRPCFEVAKTKRSTHNLLPTTQQRSGGFGHNLLHNPNLSMHLTTPSLATCQPNSTPITRTTSIHLFFIVPTAIAKVSVPRTTPLHTRLMPHVLRPPILSNTFNKYIPFTGLRKTSRRIV